MAPVVWDAGVACRVLAADLRAMGHAVGRVARCSRGRGCQQRRCSTSSGVRGGLAVLDVAGSWGPIFRCLGRMLQVVCFVSMGALIVSLPASYVVNLVPAFETRGLPTSAGSRPFGGELSRPQLSGFTALSVLRCRRFVAPAPHFGWIRGSVLSEIAARPPSVPLCVCFTGAGSTLSGLAMEGGPRSSCFRCGGQVQPFGFVASAGLRLWCSRASGAPRLTRSSLPPYA